MESMFGYDVARDQEMHAFTLYVTEGSCSMRVYGYLLDVQELVIGLPESARACIWMQSHAS